MSRKLAALLLCLGILLLPHAATAHVFVKDKVGSTGAILHINPDDDPVASKQASLFFDIQGMTPNSQTRALLTITDDQNSAANVAATLAESTVAADYTFPRQGLYTIDLAIVENGKVLHDFTQSQRISRGALGDTTTSSSPVWAEAGVVFSALAAAIVAIVVFNRRHAINKYSKL